MSQETQTLLTQILKSASSNRQLIQDLNEISSWKKGRKRDKDGSTFYVYQRNKELPLQVLMRATAEFAPLLLSLLSGDSIELMPEAELSDAPLEMGPEDADGTVESEILEDAQTEPTPQTSQR